MHFFCMVGAARQGAKIWINKGFVHTVQSTLKAIKSMQLPGDEANVVRKN